MHNAGLLRPEEHSPVSVDNEFGRSAFLLIGDHAGVAVPAALDGLGIDPAEFGRHIAIDLGIEALGKALAARIDAPFLHQHYSRLVIDCNRDPARPDAMPEVSDGTVIPANQGLSGKARAARVAAIHTPYHDRLAAIIAARQAEGRETILIALHSFTPAMNGLRRPWQVGVLHDGGDTRYAHALIDTFRADPALTVGDNEPYRMDLIDYSIPRHAYPGHLPYAEIEVRQDLLGDVAGIAEWCERLAVALDAARVACSSR